MRLFKVRSKKFFAHYEHGDETVYHYENTIVLAESEEDAIKKVLEKEGDDKHKVEDIKVIESDIIVLNS